MGSSGAERCVETGGIVLSTFLVTVTPLTKEVRSGTHQRKKFQLPKEFR